MQVTSDDGTPLTKLLAKRDALSKHLRLMRSAIDCASVSNRYSRSEIKNVATVDVKKLRKHVDELSQQYRLLDMEIQTLNFMYDLIE